MTWRKRTIMEMAREVKMPYDFVTGEPTHLEKLEALVALAREDERNSMVHSLRPGEMELSIRREHNGKLLFNSYRFTNKQVLYCTANFVEQVAGRLNAEIEAEITRVIREEG